MKRLFLLGGLSLLPYTVAWQLQDLRAHTVEFEIAFFAAFILYSIAVVVILRGILRPSRFTLGVLFLFAILFRLILIFTPPTLSDDMYRYVWDGRVQAQGISPYAFPPAASQLEYLRDNTVWSHINRKESVTVYPAGAEIVYAVLWKIFPDRVRGYQIAMMVGDMLAGILLILLLRTLKLPATRAVIYLWNPLVIFETAHAAHIDGIVLPFLIAAFLARTKNRDTLTGIFLGFATAIKLYPIVLLPALWRTRDEQKHWHRNWQTPLAFSAAVIVPYLPYLRQDTSVLGFLPNYFNERFNMGLASIITDLIEKPPAPVFSMLSQAMDGSGARTVNLLLALTLLLISVALVIHPAQNGADALRRCIFPIGAFTLLTQNLFPWYMLWLVPLLALFLQHGRYGLQFDAWTGWFAFAGLVALAYTFFIDWQPLTWAWLLEFVPLYAILVIAGVRALGAWRARL